MKRENRNYEESLDAMHDYLDSFAELDLMECDDAGQHHDLAVALAGRLADIQPAEDQRSTFKHINRCLAALVWRAEDGWQDWEDVDFLAEELVRHLPDGWTEEDVCGLWERAIDVAKKRVPPMRNAAAVCRMAAAMA